MSCRWGMMYVLADQYSRFQEADIPVCQFMPDKNVRPPMFITSRATFLSVSSARQECPASYY